MRDVISVSLPRKIRRELDQVTKENGVSRSDVIRQSVQDYLFLHRYRRLRNTMTRRARARGIYTEEDVFRIVS